MQYRQNGGYEERTERPIGELFSELANETGTLIKQELELAKTELKRSAQHASKGATSLGIGAVLGAYGAMAVLAGVIALLATFMPVWVSAMLVGIAMLVGAFVFIKKGTAEFKATEMAPRESIQSVREDVLWLTKRK